MQVGVLLLAVIVAVFVATIVALVVVFGMARVRRSSRGGGGRACPRDPYVATGARRASQGAGVGCFAASLVGLCLFFLVACGVGGFWVLGARHASREMMRAEMQARRAEAAARLEAEARVRDGMREAGGRRMMSMHADSSEELMPDEGEAADDATGPAEADSASESVGVQEPGEAEAAAKEGAEQDEEDSDSTESPSVAPEGPAGGVVIPPGRPSWVESAPVRDGKIHRTAVSSGLQPRPRDCRVELDKQLKAAADEYINWYLGRPNAAAWLGYRLPYIKSNLLRPENVYDEVIQVSFGPMHQSHALLEFDESFRRELDDRWRGARAGVRLLETGLGAGLILALVTTLFGYFRLDTATRGFYTRRLRLAASAAILAWIVVAMLLARSIPWI